MLVMGGLLLPLLEDGVGTIGDKKTMGLVEDLS